MTNTASGGVGGPGPSAEPAVPLTVLGRRPPSLRRNSAARLVSDVWTLVMSLVAATVTARLLGLAGKGFYSSLVLLAGAAIQVFSAGLGEAALVLVGQGRFSLRSAASATWAATVPLAATGGGIFIVVANALLRPTTPGDHRAVVLAGILVGVMVCYTTAVSFLLALERLGWVAGLAIVLATVTSGALVVLVAFAHRGAEGAILGALLGSVATLLASVALLARVGLLSPPRWIAAFLRPAARLGTQMQLSNLLVTLTARVDLVMVYRLRSPGSAGIYSVALTVGSLVGIVPIAVSYALFPRLAWVDEDQARSLTTQMFRIGIAVAGLVGVGLALVTPLILPLAFGHSYRGAVTPTLVLLPAGVLSSGQWLLARAEAARGRPRALWLSFGVNFVTMISVDILLIPALGPTGAALGSLIACTVGFAIAAWSYRGSGLRWTAFLPRLGDLTAVVPIQRLVPPRYQPQHTRR